MNRTTEDLKKHRREFQRALNNHKYEQTDEGILFPAQHVMARGVYVHDVNGQDERMDSNLLTTEGLTHMLNTEFHDATKVATWYFALFSGNVTVQATWTAANFTANATEITSNTEGYSETVRQTFVEAEASAANVNNTASKAAFTIATATSIIVWGAGLLSSSTKGGTTGTLMSASKFSASRTLYNTDSFSLGYSLTLTST